MSFVKYRVKEVAADFGVTPKDIAEIVGKYFEKPRSNTQVLTDEQLNVVFDVITQKHQIASLEQVFAVAPQAKKPEPKKERPRSPLPSPHRAALRPQMPRPLRRAPTRPPSPSRSSASASAASSIPLPSPSMPTALTTGWTVLISERAQNYSGGKQKIGRQEAAEQARAARSRPRASRPRNEEQEKMRRLQTGGQPRRPR